MNIDQGKLGIIINNLSDTFNELDVTDDIYVGLSNLHKAVDDLQALIREASNDTSA